MSIKKYLDGYRDGYQITLKAYGRPAYRYTIGAQVYILPTRRYGKIVGMSQTKGRAIYMVKVNGFDQPRSYSAAALRKVSHGKK